MSLRLKTLSLIGCALLLLLVVLSTGTDRLLRAHHEAEERSQARKAMHNARRDLEERLQWLGRTTEDWGAWDAAYNFVSAQKTTFLLDELTPPTLLNLRIDLIVCFDTSGEILHASRIDIAQKRIRPVTPVTLARLRAYYPAMHPTMDAPHTGILSLPDGPMLTSISMIRRGDRSGAPVGLLLMGRYLTQASLAGYLDTPSATLAVLRPDAALGTSFSLRRLSEAHMVGEAQYRDLAGHPAFLLRLPMERTSYLDGRRSRHLLVGLICLFGGVLGAVMLWLLESLVLRRVSRLEQDLQRIARTGDASERLSVSRGHDELDHLAGAVNQVLAALAEAEGTLRDYNEELEALVQERTEELRKSETRFRHLFEDNQTVIVLIDPLTGGIVDANPAACAFYGYELATLCTLGMWEINTLPREEVSRCMREALSGVRQHFLFQHRLASGEVRDVEVRSGAIHVEDRILLCALVVDITERRRVEQALATERAYLLAAIEMLPIPMALYDSATDTYRLNQAEQALYARYGVATIREVRLLDPETHVSLPHAQWPCQRALRGETLYAAPYLLVPPQGDPLDIRVYASPVRVDGAIVAAVRAIEDVTPFKNVERAKDEFIAVLSHELQTPLTSMLGWSDMALAQESPAFLRQAMEVVQRNARRQQILVRDLLDVSKLLHRKLELTLVPLDLVQQVGQTLESFRQELERWGGQITLALSPDPLPMCGDADRLQQCIANLLQNSLKFTPSGGTITLSCFRDGASAVVTVSDTGRGISPDVLPALFTPFQQVDRDERTGGLGLGLAIVHGLVTLHGGRITAHSAGLHHGSTFRLEFPLAEAVPSCVSGRC